MKFCFGRLSSLGLQFCLGDIRMFIETAPILNLQSLFYHSDRGVGEDDEIVSAIASSYRTVTSFDSLADFESSASLLKIVECCRDLKKLAFLGMGGNLVMGHSDILAISPLPRLRSIMIS
jgi:hypothetical protein